MKDSAGHEGFAKHVGSSRAAFLQRGASSNVFYPLYEAGDTFLFTPGEATKTASHVRDSLDMKRMMSIVVIALGPCIYMALHNTGHQAHQAIEIGAAAGPLDTWREPVFASLGGDHQRANWFDDMLYGALWFLPVYIVTMTVGGLWEVLFCMCFVVMRSTKVF